MPTNSMEMIVLVQTQTRTDEGLGFESYLDRCVTYFGGTIG